MHIGRRFYWRILQKNKLYSGFKTPLKKIRETKTLDSIHAQKAETSSKTAVHGFNLPLPSSIFLPALTFPTILINK
jgi:hypothetical protein